MPALPKDWSVSVNIMKLLIDIGNTSAKLIVADGNDFLHFERRTGSWSESIGRLLKEYEISACVISTVATEDKELIAALSDYALRTTWLTWQTPNPIKPDCVPPEGMGADRWAADIAAMAAAPDSTILVVDAGTCVTYDVWSADGICLGGGISPGVQLRLKAMHEHTALLPLLNATNSAPLLGNDTESAMLTGAVNGTRLEIEGFIRSIMKQYPDLRVFVTGGNEFCFSSDILDHVSYDPHLVLKGLNLVN